jgi:hypothetical protein
MPVRFAGILAASMLAGHTAFAAPCVKPADIAAFNVIGLKSRLMVAALSCHADHASKDYAAFLARFHSGLQKRQRQLRAYFTRLHGRRGEREREAYMTSLANAQSQLAVTQGRAFCDSSLLLFRQVLALGKGADLADFAASNGLIQPIALIACTGPGRAIRTAEARTASSDF